MQDGLLPYDRSAFLLNAKEPAEIIQDQSASAGSYQISTMFNGLLYRRL